jgi:raffinose/stachyose/melibiose transport system permease protein
MKEKAIKYLFILLLIVFLIIQIYPVIWLFIASLKDSVELSTTPFSLPKAVTYENYKNVLGDGVIGGYMWNSLKITMISLVLILVLSATIGFALSKFRYKHSKKIYSFFMFGIMVPVQITLIPLFIFYSKIGILNTSMAMVLPQVGFALPLSVMMFVNFYSFVPDELIEAGIVDGCSPYRVFLQIVAPLARNTMITIASMYSILIWNDFIFANTFISDSSAKTITMGLKDYVGAFGNVDWGATYAAISIAILPPILIYFSLNKWVTSGMTAGATKG